MLQFFILFYAKYTILATQRGGHGPMPWAMPPPKYASAARPSCHCLLQHKIDLALKLGETAVLDMQLVILLSAFSNILCEI